MRTLYTVASVAQAKLKAYTVCVLLLLLGLVLPTGEAVSQQAGPTFHRYMVRAVLTAEGLKNLQKQPPTALKAGVAKFVESVGGKLEFWYFDYGAATAYSVIDYPDEVSAAHRRGVGQSCRKVAPRPPTATTIDRQSKSQ
jgi:uncharacterized protein with GYD domain